MNKGTEQKNHAVLVTAGCGGLGKEISVYLARNGWSVFPTTRSRASECSFQNSESFGNMFPVELVFDSEDEFFRGIDCAFQEIEAKGLLLSGVVHCAASRLPQKLPAFLKDEDWIEEFRVSVIRFSQLAFKAAERMRLCGIGGSLVALGSLYGHHGVDRTIYDRIMLENGLFTGMPYAVAKAGLEHLVRCLALEFGNDGIRVNCVASGGIENNQKQTDFFQNAYSERTPLRRLGKASDIPGAVAYFLSSASAYLTGHILPVDGGWCAR